MKFLPWLLSVSFPLKQAQQLRVRMFVTACLSLLFIIAGCQSRPSQSSGEQDSDSPPTLDRSLELSNATLEQANAAGETLWKIQAERAGYSQDQKEGRLEKITANVFEDGELVLQLSADVGRVLADGEKFLLEQQIVATDPRNQATIRAEQVEWHPQDNVLIVRQNLRGTHQNLDVTATQGRYYPETERLELVDNVVATANEPPLQLKTNHLIWEIPTRKLMADQTTLVRYQEDTVTDRAVADRAEVDLNATTARLHNNVELKSLEPLVTIATNSLTWNYQEQTASTNEPVQIIDREDNITVTGNQAEVDLEQEVAHLQGGIKSTSSQAILYANELIWALPAQTLEAKGSVIYQQSDPPLNLTGDRAVGNLENNQITVSGNSDERVLTEIVP